MSAKFRESFGSKLAEQWITTLLTPAFVFWAGGCAALLGHFGWITVSTWFNQQPEPLQIALLIVGFCLITVSAFVVERFDLAVLRFLEGYWYPWLRPIRRRLTAKEDKRSKWIDDNCQELKRLHEQSQKFARIKQLTQQDTDEAIELIWQQKNPREFHKKKSYKEGLKKLTDEELAQQVQKFARIKQLTQQNTDEAIELIWQQKNPREFHKEQFYKKRLQKLTDEELALCLHQAITQLKDELALLDWQQMHLPPRDQLMPTRLGNILRAAERRPLQKYGLDAIICWSRLWLLLPDTAKKELKEARANLNAAARLCLWSLLFIVWTFWAWWAAPLGIISAWFAYFWALDAAIAYGELIEAVFDIYRHRLYLSLRWQLPRAPDEERRVGQQLTQYLWRGYI